MEDVTFSKVAGSCNSAKTNTPLGPIATEKSFDLDCFLDVLLVLNHAPILFMSASDCCIVVFPLDNIVLLTSFYH